MRHGWRSGTPERHCPSSNLQRGTYVRSGRENRLDLATNWTVRLPVGRNLPLSDDSLEFPEGRHAAVPRAPGKGNLPATSVHSDQTSPGRCRPVRSPPVSRHFHPRVASVHRDWCKAFDITLISTLAEIDSSLSSSQRRSTTRFRWRFPYAEIGRNGCTSWCRRGNATSTTTGWRSAVGGSTSCWMVRILRRWPVCSSTSGSCTWAPEWASRRLRDLWGTCCGYFHNWVDSLEPYIFGFCRNFDAKWPTRIHLIWIVKNAEMFTWFADELTKLQERVGFFKLKTKKLTN